MGEQLCAEWCIVGFDLVWRDGLAAYPIVRDEKPQPPLRWRATLRQSTKCLPNGVDRALLALPISYRCARRIARHEFRA
jgi:hypothetical protein